MTYGKHVQHELRPLTRELRRMIPDVYKGFAELHDAALVDGALDTKTKDGLGRLLKGGPVLDGRVSVRGECSHRTRS